MTEKTSTRDAIRFQTFEKAREAALTLLALKHTLTAGELETLEILLDKASANQIAQSMKEAQEGKLEPIENIVR